MGSRKDRGRGARTETISLHVRFLLALVGRMGPIYRLLRVDHRVLMELLRTRLLLDDRRRRREGDGSRVNNIGFGLMLVMFFLVGLALGVAAFAVTDPMVYMSVVATAVLFLMIFPLLTDLTVVLFDTSDIELLSSLPIEDRTVVAARVTTVLSYVGVLLLAIGLGPVVLGCAAYSTFGYLVVVLLALLQATALAVAFVLILYLTALKTLDLSRFRDALVYAQGGAFVVFYAATQLGPRLAERFGFDLWLAEHPETLYVLPTTAPGALLRMVQGAGQPLDPWLAVTGLLVSVTVVLWAMFLARDGVISQLAQAEASGGRALAKARRYGLGERLGKWTRGTLDRAGGAFFLAMASSDRAFKMRALPGMAFLLIPLLSMLLIRDEDEFGEVLKYLAFVPYVLFLNGSSIWSMAYFAESWEGRWIFDELEEERRAQITRGAMQACLARYLVAPLIWLLPVMFAFTPLSSSVGYLFASGVVVCAGLWVLPMHGRAMPFSRKASTLHAARGQNLLLSIGILLLGIALGIVHALLSSLPYVIEVGTPIVLFLAWRAWRGFERRILPDLERRRPQRGRRHNARMDA